MPRAGRGDPADERRARLRWGGKRRSVGVRRRRVGPLRSIRGQTAGNTADHYEQPNLTLHASRAEEPSARLPRLAGSPDGPPWFLFLEVLHGQNNDRRRAYGPAPEEISDDCRMAPTSCGFRLQDRLDWQATLGARPLLRRRPNNALHRFYFGIDEDSRASILPG